MKSCYAEVLCKALQSGDWNFAKEFLKLQPNSKTPIINTTTGMTALHVSVEAGHVHIVKALVKQMSNDDLEVQDHNGNTALMKTTYTGQYKMAKIMLRKNKKLVSIGKVGYGRKTLPVVNAISYGHVKMARYLYSLTPPEDLSPEKGNSGSTLCTQAIYNVRALDIALDLIKKYPDLALTPDRSGRYSPIFALASMPTSFPSGKPLVFWKKWIYSCIHIQLENGTSYTNIEVQEDEECQSNEVKTNRSSVRDLLRWLFSKLIKLLDIEHLYEMKLVHKQSRELLNLMCKEIVISDHGKRHKGNVNAAIFRAIKKGAFEFVQDVLRANPELLWIRDGNSRNIFSYAVLCRQAEIFSLIYGIDMKNRMALEQDSSLNNILHMAGMPPVSNMLDDIYKLAQLFKSKENYNGLRTDPHSFARGTRKPFRSTSPYTTLREYSDEVTSDEALDDVSPLELTPFLKLFDASAGFLCGSLAAGTCPSSANLLRRFITVRRNFEDKVPVPTHPTQQAEINTYAGYRTDP
ncbi:hypothetical protein F2P56_012539 [Juglans regia]|uniref:Uncharacterized protein n=1 Tax=Juglans regia TaxID=51240 RepID=A0A834CQY7_JUGRE|nr:hypothetical protein F2P56_012539 [Juglans regia]